MGTTDPNGIYMYDDTDPLVPFSALLNTGQASVSAKFSNIDPGLIHYVANVTERSELASTFNPTATKPLFVYRANAAPGARLEYSTNGTAWTTIGSMPSGEVASTSTNTINATGWAALPNAVSLGVTLPAKAKVEIVGQAWGAVNASAIRFGVLASGATSIEENIPAWGSVAYLSTGSGTVGGTLIARKVVELNSGTTTLSLRAYRGTTGTASVNYPVLTYNVLSWV